MGLCPGELGMAGEGVQNLFTEQAVMEPEVFLETYPGTSVSQLAHLQNLLWQRLAGRTSQVSQRSWSSAVFVST